MADFLGINQVDLKDLSWSQQYFSQQQFYDNIQNIKFIQGNEQVRFKCEISAIKELNSPGYLYINITDLQTQTYQQQYYKIIDTTIVRIQLIGILLCLEYLKYNNFQGNVKFVLPTSQLKVQFGYICPLVQQKHLNPKFSSKNGRSNMDLFMRIIKLNQEYPISFDQNKALYSLTRTIPKNAINEQNTVEDVMFKYNGNQSHTTLSQQRKQLLDISTVQSKNEQKQENKQEQQQIEQKENEQQIQQQSEQQIKQQNKQQQVEQQQQQEQEQEQEQKQQQETQQQQEQQQEKQQQEQQIQEYQKQQQQQENIQNNNNKEDQQETKNDEQNIPQQIEKQDVQSHSNEKQDIQENKQQDSVVKLQLNDNTIIEAKDILLLSVEQDQSQKQYEQEVNQESFSDGQTKEELLKQLQESLQQIQQQQEIQRLKQMNENTEVKSSQEKKQNNKQKQTKKGRQTKKAQQEKQQVQQENQEKQNVNSSILQDSTNISEQDTHNQQQERVKKALNFFQQLSTEEQFLVLLKLQEQYEQE